MSIFCDEDLCWLKPILSWPDNGRRKADCCCDWSCSNGCLVVAVSLNNVAVFLAVNVLVDEFVVLTCNAFWRPKPTRWSFNERPVLEDKSRCGRNPVLVASFLAWIDVGYDGIWLYDDTEERSRILKIIIYE